MTDKPKTKQEEQPSPGADQNESSETTRRRQREQSGNPNTPPEEAPGTHGSATGAEKSGQEKP